MVLFYWVKALSSNPRMLFLKCQCRKEERKMSLIWMDKEIIFMNEAVFRQQSRLKEFLQVQVLQAVMPQRQQITWASCWPIWRYFRDNIFVTMNCSWTIPPVQKVQTGCVSKSGVQDFSQFLSFSYLFIFNRERGKQLNVYIYAIMSKLKKLPVPAYVSFVFRFLFAVYCRIVQEFCPEGTSRPQFFL